MSEKYKERVTVVYQSCIAAGVYSIWLQDCPDRSSGCAGTVCVCIQQQRQPDPAQTHQHL